MDYYWEPHIETETAYGTRTVSLFAKHLTERKIFLFGDIDDMMAEMFLSQILYLNQDTSLPVTMYINSKGGNVNAGMMIYDLMRDANLEITTICTGMAASMAALLFAAGKKGRRFILKHSKVMIHEPYISAVADISTATVKELSESLLEKSTLVNGIMAYHTGNDIEKIKKASSYNNWMDAEEAVSFGICDAVLDKLI